MDDVQQRAAESERSDPFTETVFHPPVGRLLLPRGRVEMVYIVDPANRQNGQSWRTSFDLDVLSRDVRGAIVPEARFKPRVIHVLTVLRTIICELAEAKLGAVYAAKAFDDRITVALWEAPHNPRIRTLDVAGWRMEWFPLKARQQCAMGFDPKLAVLDDMKSWPE